MPTRRRWRLAAALPALAILASACANAATLTPAPSPTAAAVAVVASPSDSPTPVPTDTPLPTDSPFPTDSPSASPSVSPPPFTGPLVATRVVVAALGIDLAVTKSPPTGVYPYCNVAMYFGAPFGQPGGDRATYLFAHARVGMFYPIYQLTILKKTPNKMLGMLVDVYTSDSMLHVYKITRVLPHQLTLNLPASATTDQLWIQTSEGPHGTPGKTQVLALPVSVAPADYAASHPKVRIVRCGY